MKDCDAVKGLLQKALGDTGAEIECFDCSRTTQMLVVRQVMPEMLKSVCRALEAEGYACEADNAFGENQFFSYIAEEEALFVSYYPTDARLHLICDVRPLPVHCVPKGAEEQLLFAQYATQNSFRSDARGYANGMGYLFRLEDNTLIAIDGGHKEDAHGFLQLMRKLTGCERPRVALWIVTHPHLDHFSALSELCKTDDVTVDAYYTCMPPESFTEPDYRVFLETMRGYEVKNRTAHTGDRFVFGKLCMETLVTGEEVLCRTPEGSIKNVNDLSLMLRFCAEGQSILFPGDAGTPEYGVAEAVAGARLRSDLYQVSHHGRTGAAHADHFASLVSPKLVLWPGNRNQIAYHEENGVSNRWLRSAQSTVTEHIVASDGSWICELPYTIQA